MLLKYFHILGDDYYTGDPCLSTIPINLDCNKETFRIRSKNINRIENPGTPNIKIFSNTKPFNGHLVPVVEEEITHKNKL